MRRRGVVSGRANQAESVFFCSLDDGVHRGRAGARRRQSHLEGVRTQDCVRIKHPAAMLGHLLGGLDLLGGMNLAHRFLGQGLVLARLTFFSQARRLESPSNRPQPIRRLGMPAGIVLQKQRILIEKSHRAYCTAPKAVWFRFANESMAWRKSLFWHGLLTCHRFVTHSGPESW